MGPKAILLANFSSASGPVSVSVSVEGMPEGYHLSICPNFNEPLIEGTLLSRDTGTFEVNLYQPFGLYIQKDNEDEQVSHLITAHFEQGTLCIHRQPEWEDKIVKHQELNTVWRCPQFPASKH